MELLPDGGWGSHKPLLKALIDIFNPYYVMELGIGLYSTPILYNNCIKYVGVEQNLEWINKILSIPEFQNLEILHHNIDIKIDQKYNDIKVSNKIELIQFYQMLKNSLIEFGLPKNEYSMLFVDNYTGCRNIAINVMFDAFDIICYHDSEAVEWYGYDFNEELKNNYSHYTLMTNCIGTSVFIRKSLKNLSCQLGHVIEAYIVQYAKQNNMDINLINFKKNK